MPVTMACPHCRNVLKVHESQFDKLGVCPYCRGKIRLQRPHRPDLPVPPAEAPEPLPEPPPLPKPPVEAISPGQRLFTESVVEEIVESDAGSSDGRGTLNIPPQGGARADGAAAAANREQTVSAAVPTEEPRPPAHAPAGAPADSPAQSASPATPSPRQARPARRRVTHAGMVFTGLAAVALTAGFYVAVDGLFGGTALGRLFHDRGWVPFGIVLLSAWAIAMLALKYRKLAGQRRALGYSVLPQAAPGAIGPADVPGLEAHIGRLPSRAQGSFLVYRVRGALAYFKARGNTQEVSGWLASQGEIDAAAVESSYTMVKVFIWAIPILGFIGTVLGISGAVGGFTQAIQGAQELDVIRTALTGVTAQLAFAFDTTLIALVMSILLMFPTSWMQKAEDDVLGAVDQYCNEQLLPRLADQREAAEQVSADQIKEAVAEAVAAHEPKLDAWGEKLGTLGESLAEKMAEKMAESWTQLNAKMQDSHQLQMEQVRTATREAAAEREAALRRIDAAGEAQLQRLSKAIDAMTERAAAVQADLSGLQERQAESFRDVVASLAENLREIQQDAHADNQTALERIHEAALATQEVLRKVLDQAGSAQAGLTEVAEATAGLVAEKMADVAASMDDVLAGRTKALEDLFAGRAESLDDVRRSVETAVAAMTEQASALAKEIQAAGAAHREAAEQAGQGLRRMTVHARQTGQQIQERLVEATREVLASLGENAKGVREEITGSSEAFDVARRETLEALARQAADFDRSVRSQQELADRLGGMAGQLESLVSSGSLVRTLVGVEAGLARLAPAVDRLNQQQNGRTNGTVRRFWSRVA